MCGIFLFFLGVGGGKTLFIMCSELLAFGQTACREVPGPTQLLPRPLQDGNL